MKKILWKMVPCLAAVALGWFFASAHYGGLLKAQKQITLHEAEKQERFLTDLLDRLTTEQKQNRERTAAEAKMFGMFASVVKAHQIHNEFDRDYVAYKCQVDLIDSLEAL